MTDSLPLQSHDEQKRWTAVETGLKVQFRDVMGYLFIPFLVYVICQCLMITFIPV